MKQWLSTGLLDSCQVQQRARTAGELLPLDTEIVQHAYKKIGKRGVDVAVIGQMLAMSKTASREDDRKIDIVVDVGVPHVAAIENHGVIQQAAIGLLNVLEIPKEFPEQIYLADLDLFELSQLHLIFSVMGKVVVTANRAAILKIHARGALTT